MATLGKKLLDLRNEHKLSQTEFADCIGVSQNAYHRWESDMCKPKVDNLQKISQYFKIDIQELLDDNEKINISNNDVSGGNNFFGNNIPSVHTLNIHPNTEVMERVLQTQEQISKLLDSQFRLIEELIKRK
ncbi:hypothetical protein FACS189429_5820 [Bacteroidia bacterium]|nr:hypothetical protein FACS189429_5820 [Bacteroidia bacterium]